MEARGLGTTDVGLVERIFQRIMAEGPVIGSRSRGRGYSKQTITFPRSAGHRQSLGGLPITPGAKGNSENRFPCRQSSAMPLARRQIAIDCGLKSVSFNTKWQPRDIEQRTVSQSSVYIQAPDGHVTPRKGLSGSKVRPVSQPAISGRLLTSPGLGPGAEHSSSPSPRPCSLQRSLQNSVSLVDEEEVEHGLVSHYRWNSSQQGQRLQSHLSSVSSGRAMKRASELVQHRMDPMYQMSGSRVSLQNRYGIDDAEMQRLKEMTQIRDDLMSDLKKMKFPYGVRTMSVASTKKQNAKIQQSYDTPQESTTEETTKPTEDKSSRQEGESTTSEPQLDRIEEHPPSEHTDSEESDEQ